MTLATEAVKLKEKPSRPKERKSVPTIRRLERKSGQATRFGAVLERRRRLHPGMTGKSPQ